MKSKMVSLLGAVYFSLTGCWYEPISLEEFEQSRLEKKLELCIGKYEQSKKEPLETWNYHLYIPFADYQSTGSSSIEEATKSLKEKIKNRQLSEGRIIFHNLNKKEKDRIIKSLGLKRAYVEDRVSESEMWPKILESDGIPIIYSPHYFGGVFTL